MAAEMDVLAEAGPEVRAMVAVSAAGDPADVRELALLVGFMSFCAAADVVALGLLFKRPRRCTA